MAPLHLLDFYKPKVCLHEQHRTNLKQKCKFTWRKFTSITQLFVQSWIHSFIPACINSVNHGFIHSYFSLLVIRL